MKNYFLQNNFSLLAEKNGEIIFSSFEHAIAPALALLGMENAKGCIVYDKTVGKAAAVVFVNVGIKFVYASIMSVTAKEFLEANGVAFECGNLIEKIYNRARTDFCPMEKAVISENDPKTALQKLCEFLGNRE